MLRHGEIKTGRNRCEVDVIPLTLEQQEAVNEIYDFLHLAYCLPPEAAITSSLRALDVNTTAPLQREIIEQLQAALVNLRRHQVADLQGILGRWGDTQDDEDTLCFLRALNAGRPVIFEVFAA